MSMYVIRYETRGEFYRGVYEAVTSGLCFEADGENLVITFTGGY